MADSPNSELFATLWDPVAGSRVWERLAASVDQSVLRSLAERPDRARAVLNFLIFSPISLEKICRRPEHLEWLSHPDVRNRKATYRPSCNAAPSDLSFAVCCV